MMLSQQESLQYVHRVIVKARKTIWMPSFIFQTTELHFEHNGNELKLLFH